MKLSQVIEVLDALGIEFDERLRCPICEETNGWNVGEELITEENKSVSLFWCMDCEKLVWSYCDNVEKE